jgi:pimeloyl-ACP methyl ester carboxylesterase
MIMKHILQYKNGYSISYAEFGDPNGFPILIQHGLIASINDEALFDSLIRAGTRLICAARPGYGDSSPDRLKNISGWADIVAVLVDHLGIPHFDVFGMSSGAPYSYALGCRFPEKVRNIFIFSGIPAMYDENILSFWPWEVNKDASLDEMEDLAFALFFSNRPPDDLLNDDIKDSMRNHGFGIAQDFLLRCSDWGFALSEVKQKVWMRHSQSDDSVPVITAQLTAALLPNCSLEIRENDVHFSNESLDDYIRTVMAGFYRV